MAIGAIEFLSLATSWDRTLVNFATASVPCFSIPYAWATVVYHPRLIAYYAIQTLFIYLLYVSTL